MKGKTQEALRDAAFEATFVVFGVVLALLANEWREHQVSVRRAEHALSSILEELEDNRASVSSSLEYHSGVIQAIDRAVMASAAPNLRTFSRGFMSAANVYRTAWDSASATGAFEDMSYATVLRLSRVYAQQDRYEHQVQGIAPIIYGELYRGGTSAILANHRNLGTLIRSLAYRERELLELYDATLATLGGRETGGPHGGGVP
ncbi:MAG TPA: hypothetical protein VE685_19305 [Thermoanaerobaculia bacterium]|nr:hypothetical protein [Thermoanaerobaculia bacterium]